MSKNITLGYVVDNNGNLIEEYLKLQEEFEKKWGERTIVIIEVGKFFEIYGVVNEKEKRGRIYEIAEFTNLTISKKNNKMAPISLNNPLMAGVPNYTISKWLDIFIKHNYTVIKIDQDAHGEDIKNKKPIRTITDIISPGINLDSNRYSNNIMALNFEEYPDYKTNKTILQIGISVIDMTTGESWVYETHSNVDDYYFCLDEGFRFMQTYNPVELIIHFEKTSLTKDKLINYLELPVHNVYFDIYKDKNILSNSYKEHILKKVFPDTNVLTPVEYIHLDKMHFALNSFIYLIHFAYEHNETIINRLQRPVICDPKKYLNLSRDSISQLDIFSNKNIEFKKYRSLWNILDKTKTSLGKRFLKQNLLHPILDINELNYRYNLVESLILNDRYLLLTTHLKDIMDIEKLHRKMAMNIMNPCSFISLDNSYKCILNLISEFKKMDIENINHVLPSDCTFKLFNQYIDKYKTSLVIDDLHNVFLNDIKHNIFKKGLYPEIDEISNNINKYKSYFKDLAFKLSSIIDNKGKKCVEVKTSDSEGHYLSITIPKLKVLKAYMKENDNKIFFKSNYSQFEFNLNNIDFKNNKSYSKVTSPEINQYSHILIGLEAKIHKLCLKKFSELLFKLHNTYHVQLNEISKFVAYSDFLTNIAFISKTNGYSKPIIHKESYSYIKAKELRHPIIEKINIQVQYIPNDIYIGDNDNKGMLLYGVNAVGKSSFMKSVGLSIVMAQCGFYVPAKEFIYSPYHHLFTRISNNDNIFKGQSSFAVEMSELRTILKRSNSKSLILGDELCSGTETISGIALVASGILRLSNLNASFIFATHLHKLSKLSRINNCGNVKHFHLKTIFDQETKTLIYNRKLQNGSGESIYGLEVAKGMDLDENFIKCADEIRKEIMNIDELYNYKTSNYNSKIIIDKCSICNNNTEEVHHINEQYLADDKNMIDTFHKNSLFNLVQLCHDCHHKVHHGNLVITGYIDTSNGVKLEYHEMDNIDNKNKRRKYTPYQIEIINDIYSNSKNLSHTRRKLSTDHKFNISIGTLKKIVNNTYI